MNQALVRGGGQLGRQNRIKACVKLCSGFLLLRRNPLLQTCILNKGYSTGPTNLAACRLFERQLTNLASQPGASGGPVRTLETG